MRQYLMVSLLVLVAWSSGWAQSQIAVQNGSTATFYYSVAEAIQGAPDGATVYLPAGSLPTDNVQISKRLRIVGIGYNPKGNPRDEYTHLVGNLTFREGSSGSSLEGVAVQGSVDVGANGDDVALENITFSRCHFTEQTLLLSGAGLSVKASRIVLSECVVNNLDGGFATDVLFLKSIFKTSVVNLGGRATFRNNVFLYNGPSNGFQEIDGATFENNIFLCGFRNITNSQLLNNIFLKGVDTDFGVLDNATSGNILNQELVDIFANVPDQVFSFDYDYQLKSTSPGLNAGTDGKHIGLYGTTQPFKTEGTPDTPHIDSYQIDSATDSQGRLYINIKVSAQSN